MAKKKQETITVNEVEYVLDDFTEEQVLLLNHVQDLDRKLHSARFNVDQLVVGRDAFINALSHSLESDPSEEE